MQQRLTQPKITIAKPEAQYRPEWEELYAGYAKFYQREQTAEMRERVWGWLVDPTEELEGYLALNGEGRPVGLAHYREFTRPLAATRGCFLDDLFVEPAARGSGAAEALMQAIAEEAQSRDWSVVRWITMDDNYRARALYDRLSTRTAWLTYEFEP